MTPAHRYWFRPARFWKWFAAYYPSSAEGWIITLILAAGFAVVYIYINARSHSIFETLLGVAPVAVIVMLVFDLLCFRTGEYPSWWRRHDPDS